jgi:cyclic pyranopterin phosphate synthase
MQSSEPVHFKDNHGRGISYLRLSVTDRCNLRCKYCWSTNNYSFMPHDHVLRYEEMLALVSAAHELGVRKIRLTGGEPLVRKGILNFIGMVAKRHPDMNIRMTTNATLLSEQAVQLQQNGLHTVNISLDTLNPSKFAAITCRDMFDRVMAGIARAQEAGMRVKINVVAMRGVNDNELPAFLDFAMSRSLDIRFIEFMPMGEGTQWDQSAYWSAENIVAEASGLVSLKPVEMLGGTHGPARMFEIEGSEGRLGVISPLSNHFCGTCNRLRITSDGRLRPCLFSDREFRLRPLLRSPKISRAQLLKVVRLAMANKPLGYEILCRQREKVSVASRRMSAIGG